MRFVSKTLPLLLATMLFALPMYAQNGRLSGKATDKDGKPIVGATVSIERQDVRQRMEVKTDNTGNYLQGVVPAGLYWIYLLGPNNQPIDGAELRINPGLTATLDFDLKNPKKMPGVDADAAAKNEAAKKQAAETKAAFDEGLAALNAKDYNTAVTKLQLATEKDPTQHVIFANLAEAYNGAKKYPEAATAYQKAIELKPDAPEYYGNLSLVLANSGKFDEATAAVQKAAELNPTQAAQGYYNLGAIYTNRGRTKEAGDAFKKATEINPQMAQAWYQLGISYFGSPTTIPDAVGVLEKFLALQPTGPDADAAKALIDAAKASTPTGFKSERQLQQEKEAADKAEKDRVAKEKAAAGKQKKQ